MVMVSCPWIRVTTDERFCCIGVSHYTDDECQYVIVKSADRNHDDDQNNRTQSNNGATSTMTRISSDTSMSQRNDLDTSRQQPCDVTDTNSSEYPSTSDNSTKEGICTLHLFYLN